MSSQALGERLGVTAQGARKLEQAEANGNITLNTLARLAHGLDCEVRYVFVPRTSLVEQVLRRNLEDLQRMASIVQDMLFLSRADCGALARRVAVGSLAAIASDVAEFHEDAMEAAGLALKIVGDGAGEFDVGLLNRALSNLVSNATRFADRGTAVEIYIALSDEEARLTVVNRGIAIDPKHVPHIFDRFYRADIARAGSVQNHGLGLAIVAAIARMHGGQVFARSENGLTSVGLTLKRHMQTDMEDS